MNVGLAATAEQLLDERIEHTATMACRYERLANAALARGDVERARYLSTRTYRFAIEATALLVGRAKGGAV